MSGGIAYVLDESDDFPMLVNLEMVDLEDLCDPQEQQFVHDMVRKHAGRPFSRGVAASAAYAAITVCGLARVMAETALGDATAWMTVSAVLWTASFGLFLCAFGCDLAPMSWTRCKAALPRA